MPIPRCSSASQAAPAVAAARILIVLHDFSGGGTERVAIRLANQWAKAGRVVRIFCGNEKGPVRRFVNADVTVEQADPPLPRGALSRVRLGFALAKAAARFTPDAIWAPGNFHILVLAAFSLRDRSGAATFCKISNPLVRRARHGAAARFRRFTLKLMTRRIDTLVAMSPALRAEADTLFDPARVASRWEPIFSAGTELSDSIVREPGLIVAAGRLEPQKNFELAITAMSRLPEGTSLRLVILGEGSERARLAGLIDELGLHQTVMLSGHVGDIKPWLRRASCFLMTSHFEGYPAALVEALVCGTPVLVTPCSPALCEILPEGGRETVEADADAIAGALQALLRCPPPSPDGSLLLRRHEEQQSAASYLALMDSVVERRRGTTSVPN